MTTDIDVNSAEIPAQPAENQTRFLRPISGLTGWKRFGFEVAVIGVGVGLALLADQWVTRYNKARAADAAYAAMYSDLSSLQIVMAQRLATQPCVDERIKSIRDALASDAPNWTPVPFPADTANNGMRGNIPPVIVVPLTPWPGTAWKSALESGVAFQMPPERYEALSELFEAVDYARVEQNNELRLLGQLSQLNISGPVTVPEKRRAYATLGEFNSANNVVWLVSATSLSVVSRLLEDNPVDETLRDKRVRDAKFAAADGAQSLGECYAAGVWETINSPSLPHTPALR